MPTQGADGTGTDDGYTYTQGVLAEGDVLVATVSGTQTDAGTSASTVTSYKVVRYAEDGTETDVTSFYTFAESVPGTLKVNKKAVTIKSADKEKTYDGTALVNGDTALATNDGWVGDEGVEVTFTGSQTDVGSSANSFTYVAKAGTNLDNYDISKTEGTLKVTKNETTITITADSGEKTYDGTALTKNQATVNGLPAALTIETVVTGTQTDAGNSANVVTSYTIKDASGKDVTANFTGVETVDGTLTVTKAALTVTTGSAEKEYDGTALTKDEATITGLVNNETATATANGSQTEVGSSDNTYTIAWGTAKADNYTITDELGTLEVTKNTAKVTLTAASADKTYDGTALTNATVTASGLPAGFTAQATASGSQTDAGSSANVVNDGFKIFDASGADKTANFTNVEKVDGTLTVSKRTVTLKSADLSKEYDGAALINGSTPLETEEGWVEGEGATYTFTGSQTLVGSSNNMFIYKLNDNTKESNYTINKTEGTLTVTNRDAKYEITVVANSATATYDGKEHSAKGFETLEFEVEGKTYTVEGLTTQDPTQVNAGTYTNNITGTAVVKDADGNIVTDQFKVNTENGKLVINKATVTVTADDKTKVYDNDASTDPELTATVEGVVAGETINYSLSREDGQDVGGYTITVTPGQNPNYDVTVEPGTFTITQLTDKVTVTITENSGTEKYDGTEKTVTGYTVSIDNELYTEKDFSFKGNDTVKGTDAGEYQMELKPEDFANTNENFSNVVFVIVDGTLTITKRTVVMTSADDTKPYDGTALTNDTVTVTGDGFAEGEGATYDVTGTITEVGESKNTFTYTLNEGTDIKNYEITQVQGTLEVTASAEEITVTITGNTATVVYNGEEHEVTGYTAKASSDLYDVEKDFTFTGTAEAARTHVVEDKDTDGNTPMGLTADMFKNTNPNFANVKFVVEDGSVTITPAPLTVDTEGATKTYDGTALTNANYTVTGLKHEETIGVENTGTQTLVGESLNTTKITWADTEQTVNTPITANAFLLGLLRAAGDPTAISTDYNLAVNLGTLKVTDGSADDPVDPSDVMTKTHEGENFGLGDTVTFTLTAKNIYDEAKTITFVEIEGVTVAQATFTDVPAGETVETTATYVVTEADLLAGKFTNELNVTFDGEAITDPIEDTVTTEEPNGHITVEKETTSEAPENGYALGDTIEYKITVKNDGNLTITDIKVTDELTKDEWTIDSLAPGETKEFTAEYEVTEADILNGSVKNVATATGTSPDPDQPDVPVTPGDTDDPTEEKNPSLNVTKETTSTAPEGGYALGDKIEYKITVENDGNVTISDITVTDDKTGDEWTIESLEPGETKEFTATYEVTEADILNGSVKNVATATGTDPEGDDPTVDPGTTEDPTEEPKPELVITKKTTSTAPEDGYALGDEITYEITAENTGNLTLTNVKVTDELTGDEWTIDSLEPGASETFTATYTVAEKDILAGSVKNEATATADNPSDDPTDVTPGDTEDPTEEPKPELVITKKTKSEAPEAGYALGDTIEYEITAENTGNLTLTNVKVTDELTGDEWTIDSLEPGASETFTATYTVAEKDILAGSVKNEATATADNPSDDPTDVTPGDTEDPTEEKNPHLTVVKTTTSTAPEAGYALGDKIEYKIVVTNDGNVTISDITVTDDLTGDEWTVDSLAPGETAEFTAEHVVTEEDVLAGSVVNNATATGTDPEDEEPTVDPGETEDPTEDKNPHLTVTKTVTSTATTYSVGDTIEYKIVVENDGNLTITDVKVSDALTGDEWTIESLEPGAKQEFTATYTVTEADANAGKVVNTATATGTDPEGNDPSVTPGTTETPVKKPELPKTGDATNMMSMVGYAAAGIMSLAAALRIRRKEDDEQ